MQESKGGAVPIPGFNQALVCFGGVLALLSGGLFVLAVDLHVVMFFCLLWAGANARWLGHEYPAIRHMMGEAIARALPAIYIFILIGMVIASFMQAGTIASLVYFGLAVLTPATFLVGGLLLCGLMSVATGTAWGTAGTMGVVLIGIGEALGLPLPLVAGVVVAGATFGDKLSPVSDTTNLAAMSAGTSLYRHIGSMLYTTLPAFLIMALVLVLVGLAQDSSGADGADVARMRSAIASAYGLNPIVTLLPLAMMLALSLRRVTAEITMAASVLVAVLIAVVYQHSPLATVLNALWLNAPGNTGLQNLDDLLGRGGIASMAWTLILALMALALGGVLHSAGFLDRLLAGLISRVRRTSSLIATTIGSGIAGNLAMGEAYISIILSCQLFRQRYDEQSLDRAVLSRSVEEGATMTTGLIPWTTAGAFYAATLGVPVLDYAPYALFNYLNGVVAVAMAALGLGLLRGKSSTASHP